MSEFKSKIAIGVVLAVIIAVGLAGTSVFLTPQTTSQTTSAPTQKASTTTVTVTQPLQTSTTSTSSPSTQGGSVLLVQLTDPPIVPLGTTSLNLTYTGIDLLVAEPITSTSITTLTTTSSSTTSTLVSTITSTKSGVMTPPQSITTGQSGTVNLLKLQNISKTLASASLPNGTIIYSVTFLVSSLTITINGVTSTVTLATGGNSLLVTLANPSTLSGTNAMLIDLTPTIVNTTSGYQMIPSAVGIIKPQSEITPQQQQVGHQEGLTNQDQQDLHHAMGQVSANLTAMSVSSNVTTLSVLVNNTGSANITLTSIDIRGNFTAQNSFCATTTQGGDNQQFNHSPHCFEPFNSNDFVFFPNSTLTSTSSCSTGTMNTVTFGDQNQQSDSNQPFAHNQLTLEPAQCVVLTFSGTISTGFGSIVVPSTLSGQQYTIQVTASNSVPLFLNCTLPVTPNSCTIAHNSFSNNGGD